MQPYLAVLDASMAPRGRTRASPSTSCSICHYTNPCAGCCGKVLPCAGGGCDRCHLTAGYPTGLKPAGAETPVPATVYAAVPLMDCHPRTEHTTIKQDTFILSFLILTEIWIFFCSQLGNNKGNARERLEVLAATLGALMPGTHAVAPRCAQAGSQQGSRA